jgi:hypothetical protein
MNEPCVLAPAGQSWPEESRVDGRWLAARVQLFVAVSTMHGDSSASSVVQADGSRGMG